MKRVLITGAGGFVGSHVLRHVLDQTNWDIVVLDSFRHMGKTDRINVQMSGYDPRRVEVISHDLKVPISPQMTTQIGKIDYVLNLASQSHVDRSIDDPRAFIENNVALTLTMLEWAREAKPKKFVQISTDEVFGPAEDDYKHLESDPHKPSNPYSASKAAQEDICYAYWRTFGVPIVRTNTMNIIGELQDPEKFVPKVIRSVLRQEKMPIHASKDGKQIGSRFYLHARNQADALLYILNDIEPVAFGEGEMSTFNIVGEREVNNLELAQMIANVIGFPLQYELVDFHGSRPGHDLRYALDGTKLKEAGWTAPLSLEASLKKTVEWSLENPEWLL